MKKLLLPLILLILGTGAGAGAGFFLKPEPEPVEEEMADVDPTIHCLPGEVHASEAKSDADDPAPEDEGAEKAYARLNNQFVIPIVTDEMVSAIVAMTLTIEVVEGDQTTIFSAEPKLRDVFLQVMFDHANTGGFSGNFTTGANMSNLRKELNRAARSIVGDAALEVLILDIVRQDN